MAERSHLPEVFTTRLHEQFGESTARRITETFVERSTTFRVNTIRAERLAVLKQLQESGIKVEPVSWYRDAFVLKNKTKRELMETEAYTTGQIYLQSLASMVPPLALDPKPRETVLDLTAAPGSKTSQIAALMECAGELIANDNNKVRFFKLKHNMEMLGVADDKAGWQFTLQMQHGVGLVKKYPRYFDKILLDAPCSAEARFVDGVRETYGYWSERKVREMAYKQRQLLLSVWAALKPGGTLVYSTCTFAPEENELQIDRLLRRFKDASIEPISLPGLTRASVIPLWRKQTVLPEVAKALRIMPTKDIEGFFIAKLKKS